MIKINLLPQKRGRRSAEPGQQQVVLGVVLIAAAFVGIYVAYQRPKASKLADLKDVNGQLASANAVKQRQLSKQKDLEALVDAEKDRGKAIAKLVKAKSVPAFLLEELGDILTPGRAPTMTSEMEARISGDPNRRYAPDWDPRHVWITSFSEKTGVFTLEGGAQSDGDVTQLAKRMQASVYFQDVTPRGGERVTDTAGSVTYYKFTITGKVVY
jgi:type IV pilus assembly protein PilN